MDLTYFSTARAAIVPSAMAREMGILTGSSLSAVVSWERRRSKPREEKKALLVALRMLRKGEVRKMLAEKAGANGKEKEEKPEVKSRRKKPAKRVTRRRK